MIFLMSNRRKNTAHLWIIWFNPNQLVGSSPMLDSTPHFCFNTRMQTLHLCIVALWKCTRLQFIPPSCKLVRAFWNLNVFSWTDKRIETWRHPLQWSHVSTRVSEEISTTSQTQICLIKGPFKPKKQNYNYIRFHFVWNHIYNSLHYSLIYGWNSCKSSFISEIQLKRWN